MKSTIAGVPVEAALLVLFDEIYQSQSVTRAAAKLDLSQPTVSVWLGKLRRALGDPLFVRTSGGMKPTPRADTLIGPAREALALLAPHLRAGIERSTLWRIAATCFFRISHDRRQPHHAAAAPARPPARRRAGGCPCRHADRRRDRTKARIRRRRPGTRLRRRPRVGLPRTSPVLTGLRMSRERAASARCPCVHATRLPRRSARGGAVVHQLSDAERCDRSGSGSNVACTWKLPGFLGLAAIVSSTDLIATVPRTIGETLARTGAIRVFACPVKLPTFSVKQYWHARYHHEPGHRWLRGRCADLFAQPMRYRRHR